MNTAIAERLSISFTEVPQDDNNYDSRQSVAILRDGTSLRQILDALGLHPGRRLTPTRKASKYKNSGQWSMYRNEDRSIRISVDVGCFCSHDCCGHQCSQSYTIQKIAYKIIVLSQANYNF